MRSEPAALFRSVRSVSPGADFHLRRLVVVQMVQPFHCGMAMDSERAALFPGVLPVSAPDADFHLRRLVAVPVQMVHLFRSEMEMETEQEHR